MKQITEEIQNLNSLLAELSTDESIPIDDFIKHLQEMKQIPEYSNIVVEVKCRGEYEDSEEWLSVVGTRNESNDERIKRLDKEKKEANKKLEALEKKKQKILKEAKEVGLCLKED